MGGEGRVCGLSFQTVKLPFQLLNIPKFRQEVLDAAERVVLQKNKKWLDILAIRGKDIVYIGTLRYE